MPCFKMRTSNQSVTLLSIEDGILRGKVGEVVLLNTF